MSGDESAEGETLDEDRQELTVAGTVPTPPEEGRTPPAPSQDAGSHRTVSTSARSPWEDLRRTGHEAVDRVLVEAAGIPGTPVTEHAAQYTDVHEKLVAELNREPHSLPSGLLPGR